MMDMSKIEKSYSSVIIFLYKKVIYEIYRTRYLLMVELPIKMLKRNVIMRFHIVMEM